MQLYVCVPSVVIAKNHACAAVLPRMNIHCLFVVDIPVLATIVICYSGRYPSSKVIDCGLSHMYTGIH